MSVYLKDGLVLLDSGNVATSPDCCCCGCTLTIDFSVHGVISNDIGTIIDLTHTGTFFFVPSDFNELCGASQNNVDYCVSAVMDCCDPLSIECFSNPCVICYLPDHIFGIQFAAVHVFCLGRSELEVILTGAVSLVVTDVCIPPEEGIYEINANVFGDALGAFSIHRDNDFLVGDCHYFQSIDVSMTIS